MKKFFGFFCLIWISYYSYGQTNYGTPEVDPVGIQIQFINWLKYQNSNIILSGDYVALDLNSKIISKEVFLSELTLGNYIPIRMQSTDSVLYYKLFKIEPASDTSIKATIMQIAFDEYEHFKMEGNPFPEFHFTDLNGNVISNETLKGKIVVIKCWYIHCTACIREFPNVNALVTKYQNRKDIVFVSLAEDAPQQLRLFLAKKPLLYLVVPNMKIYMNETLHLNAFPTHFILNKEGKIAKVLSNYESLEVALEKEIIK